MPKKLIVALPFAKYLPGEMIVDAAEIAGILSGENAIHVVCIASEPAFIDESVHISRG
jgi:hypothetical protein